MVMATGVLFPLLHPMSPSTPITLNDFKAQLAAAVVASTLHLPNCVQSERFKVLLGRIWWALMAPSSVTSL